MKRLFVFFISIIMSIPYVAYGTDGEREGWLLTPDVCKGWHCYKEELLPSSPEKKLKEQGKHFDGEVDWAAVWTIPPTELKTLINDAMSYAQEAPRDQNRMRTYMSLQFVAMSRAQEFQRTWNEVLLNYPVLDTTTQRAPTTLGSRLEAVADRDFEARAIEGMRNNMGILFFYAPTCAYCERQTQILDSFIQKWDWKNIEAINIVEHPEVIEQFGVQSVPDLWVVGNVHGELKRRRLKAGLAEFAHIEGGLASAWNLWFGSGEVYERPKMTHTTESFKQFIERVGQ